MEVQKHEKAQRAIGEGKYPVIAGNDCVLFNGAVSFGIQFRDFSHSYFFGEFHRAIHIAPLIVVPRVDFYLRFIYHHGR